MSDKKLLLFFLFILILASALNAFAQEQDEQRVRGAFLTTRINATPASSATPTASTTSTRKPRHRPVTKKSSASATTASNKPHTSNSNASANGKPVSANGKPTTTSVQNQSATGNGNANAASASNTNANAAASGPATLAPIGLGYTLYLRDEQNRAVRVDPAREFHAGDRIRLSLETNTDGFLYVFHTENDGVPRMIYPDARLDDGGNYVTAHVPYEIPDSVDKDERLHWFVFDAQPAVERLYIVVTREPLEGVPVEDELVNYCQANKGQCPWQPQAATWARIASYTAAQVAVVKSKSYGQEQTANEHDATTRGFGLDKSAPEPSIIRMSATANAPVLLTTVDLIHK